VGWKVAMLQWGARQLRWDAPPPREKTLRERWRWTFAWMGLLLGTVAGAACVTVYELEVRDHLDTTVVLVGA
jgi:hypothetical protein